MSNNEIQNIGGLSNAMVHIPLREVDQLRAEIVRQNKIIKEYKENEKRIKIKLLKPEKKYREGRSPYDKSGNTQYGFSMMLRDDPNYDPDDDNNFYWSHVIIESHKNIDDIMNGLQQVVEKKMRDDYDNNLENKEKENVDLRKELQLKNDHIANLEGDIRDLADNLDYEKEQRQNSDERLEKEIEKNSNVKEELEKANEYIKSLQIDVANLQDRNVKLINKLESKSWFGRFSKFVGF